MNNIYDWIGLTIVSFIGTVLTVWFVVELTGGF